MCNIDDSIHIAVKAALYPRAPLFDEATDKLTPSAVTAFKRIFRLCDRDFDGLLNDEEINYFQVSLKLERFNLQNTNNHSCAVDVWI